MKRFLQFCFPLLMVFAWTGVAGAEMTITSPDFAQNGDIPPRFTCQGEDVSPELAIDGIPEGTRTLALIVDDPDAPVGTWVHWVVINIPPTDKIREDAVPGDEVYNDFKKISYGGPCPPFGKHRYFFKLYALDRAIPLVPQMKKKDVLLAMKGHVLEKAVLIGRYEKK